MNVLSLMHAQTNDKSLIISIHWNRLMPALKTTTFNKKYSGKHQINTGVERLEIDVFIYKNRFFFDW